MQHLKELWVLILILGAFAGLVTAWAKQRAKVQEMDRVLSEALKRHMACSQLQTERFNELKDEIRETKDETKTMHGEVAKALAVLTQEFRDHAKYTEKNGHERRQ